MTMIGNDFDAYIKIILTNNYSDEVDYDNANDRQ